MLSNYLKVAIRQLLKNKTFSFINILGLSVGVACCALLALFIQDEFSYEQHFPGHERIQRLTTTFVQDGKANNFPRTSPPIAMQLADLLPEVEIATRTVNPPEVEQHLIKYKDKQFYEKNALLADSTFFDVFQYPFLEGDGATALDAPSTVVISEALSKKIFNGESALDELLIINSGRSIDTFRVTGVLKEIPGKSHLDASFYMSMNSDGWGKYVLTQTTWAWNNFVSGYVKIRPGASAANAESKLPALLEERAGADLKGAGITKALHFQPLDDIRLYSNFNSDFGDMGTGSITYIYILGSIGVFMLLIACINFMNLTTAKAAQRAQEVGIRKSMGAYKSHLVRQFLGESFTIVAASLILAVILIALTLPVVNDLTHKTLTIGSSNFALLAGALLAIGLITGLVAGSYPAFYLSSFDPARVLKSKGATGDGSTFLRQGLVVFQFIITITLISSIVIIQQQLSFIRDQSLGFSDKETIMLPFRTREAAHAYKNLKNEFAQIPGVKKVSATTSLPSTTLFQDFFLYPEGSTNDKGVLHRVVHIDENYFDVLNIDMLKGRDVIFPADTFSYAFNENKIIVNEQSLKTFNIDPEKAIGSRLFAEWEGKLRVHTIIGVVKDFHQFSLHQPIVPMLFFLPSDPNQYIYMSASLEGNDIAGIRAKMQEAWQKIIPGTPFESQMLSDSVKNQYESDDRINIMLTLSTILAIIISCMGLYGLSIFVAERRLKEIGIRKVLGASVTGIVGMLSLNFIRLVMIAFVLAVPIGYYMMNKWLEGFAYKISLGVSVFIVAGLVSFAIAWITVGFESVRAALGNPVKALRSE